MRRILIWGRMAPRRLRFVASAPGLAVSRRIASVLREGGIVLIFANVLIAKIGRSLSLPRVRIVFGLFRGFIALFCYFLGFFWSFIFFIFCEIFLIFWEF